MAPFALRWVLRRVQAESGGAGATGQRRARVQEHGSRHPFGCCCRYGVGNICPRGPSRSPSRDNCWICSVKTEAFPLPCLPSRTKSDGTIAPIIWSQLKEYFHIEEVVTKVVVSDNPADAILDEARKKTTTCLVLGATEQVTGLPGDVQSDY